MRFTTITTICAVISGLVSLNIAKPIPNWNASDGIAIPLARHSSFLNSNESIDLDAFASHGIFVREKIFSGLENYEMNTGRMHPFAVKRTDSELGRRGVSVPLTKYVTKLWSCEISIGTPPKTLKVYIDTSSADMWVLETGCEGISSDRNLWDPDLSQSSMDQWKSFRLEYADGTTVKGNRYTDKVTIAGFTADSQSLGSATSYSSLQTREDLADGLLGLAFPSVSRFRAHPLFTSPVEQRKLINPTFSLKLSSSGAEMYVGGANSMLYKGDITYIPVTYPASLWQVSMDDVRVNGQQIFKNIPVFFDTGANYIFGDMARVSELYRRIGSALVENKGYGFYCLPCDSFPAVSLTFGGKSSEIPPEFFRLPSVAENSPDCFGAVIAQRVPSAFWTIGSTFLQGVYTVFDCSTPQIRFADLA